MKQFTILAALFTLSFAVACGGTNDGRRDATTVGAQGWVREGGA